MDVSNDENASKDIPPKTNNPLASKHDPNDTMESNAHIHTFNQNLFNTNDDIPSSYPEPLDWNQHGPTIFDRFDNDDAPIIDFEIYEGIMIDNHKEVISPKENTLAYFLQSTPPSSYKGKRGKNTKHRSLGKTKKAPLDHEQSKDKKLPRVQDEKYVAMNMSAPVFNMPKILLELSQLAFM
jgi:hypothetical protein